jgi:thimet oligopeptidase
MVPLFFQSARRFCSSSNMTKQFINHLRFDWEPSQIREQANLIMRSSKQVLDSIANTPKASVSTDIIRTLNEMHRVVMAQQSSIDFLQNVSTSKEVREASREADKLLSDFWVEMSMRKDIFDRLCDLDEHVSNDVLTKEEARFLHDEILDGKRNGLHFSVDIRSEVETIKKNISKLAIDFSTNIAEDSTYLEFTKEELSGCQPDFFDSLEKSSTDESKYKVTLQYPHYIPVMRDCVVRETRKAMEFKYNSRCKEVNLPILAEIVELRNKKAKLLGYTSHADFILEKRMAKDANSVGKFLDSLVDKINTVGIADKDKALLKKYRLEAMNIPMDAPFENCDTAFLRNLVEKREFNVDHPAIQRYFPLEHVTEKMLDIYSELLDLKFDKVLDNSQPIWHPDVVCYLVSDRSDNHSVGIFYFDPFPRDGKYSHAALFPLQASVKDKQVGVCSLVCNFTKPTASNPSLLTHDEVTTLFHEFGHCMHHLCAEKVTMVSYAGTSVERDFVECPSQMLENWCWEPSVLKKMSKHVETGESLSDELIGQLVKSRNANEGIGAQRQIAFALFDQLLHSGSIETKPESITKLYFDVYSRVTGFTPTAGTSMPASFGHLCGYDAQYYGYLWAEVFSADLYVSKFAAGNRQLSTQAGREYREKVLGPGGSIDASDILREYLGREPNMDAFFKLKGMVKTDGKL